MSLIERIRTDQIGARKAKDKFKASILTTLLSEAMRPGLDDGKRESTDAEVIKVVNKFIKNMNETLKVKYSDDVHTELCIVSEYLPTQLTEGELIDIAEGFFAVNDSASMGQAMAWFKSRHEGQYDGKTLSNIIRSMLK